MNSWSLSKPSCYELNRHADSRGTKRRKWRACHGRLTTPPSLIKNQTFKKCTDRRVPLTDMLGCQEAAQKPNQHRTRTQKLRHER
ncbi:MAG: hypothetical protein ABL884_07845 [Methyloglobulus sp.]